MPTTSISHVPLFRVPTPLLADPELRSVDYQKDESHAKSLKKWGLCLTAPDYKGPGLTASRAELETALSCGRSQPLTERQQAQFPTGETLC